jgi:hypothetical protein
MAMKVFEMGCMAMSWFLFGYAGCFAPAVVYGPDSFYQEKAG